MGGFITDALSAYEGSLAKLVMTTKMERQPFRRARAVILSGAKDPTFGIRVYCNQLKIDEATMIKGSLQILAC